MPSARAFWRLPPPERQRCPAPLHSNLQSGPNEQPQSPGYWRAKKSFENHAVKSLIVDAALVICARGCPLAARVLTLLALARSTLERTSRMPR